MVANTTVSAQEVQIYTLGSDVPVVPTPRTDYRAQHAGSECAILIDNGGYECRVGWSTEAEPAGSQRP